MKEFGEKIKKYREDNNISLQECAEKLEITEENLIEIESGTIEITKAEKKRITSVLGLKEGFNGKKAVKFLDLFFRFGSAVMALVTLLLCINGNVEEKILIVLLSIGVVCSSLTILPKIEK